MKWWRRKKKSVLVSPSYLKLQKLQPQCVLNMCCVKVETALHLWWNLLGEKPHSHNFYCQVKSISRVRLFSTPWTVAYQALPSMGFSRQEYWSGLPFPPEDLPDPGIEPKSPTLEADALLSEPPGKSLSNTSSQVQRTIHLRCYFH